MAWLAPRLPDVYTGHRLTRVLQQLASCRTGYEAVYDAHGFTRLAGWTGHHHAASWHHAAWFFVAFCLSLLFIVYEQLLHVQQLLEVDADQTTACPADCAKLIECPVGDD